MPESESDQSAQLTEQGKQTKDTSPAGDGDEYDCDYMCGYHGSFQDVEQHEGSTCPNRPTNDEGENEGVVGHLQKEESNNEVTKPPVGAAKRNEQSAAAESQDQKPAAPIAPPALAPQKESEEEASVEGTGQDEQNEAPAPPEVQTLEPPEPLLPAQAAVPTSGIPLGQGGIQHPRDSNATDERGGGSLPEGLMLKLELDPDVRVESKAPKTDDPGDMTTTTTVVRPGEIEKVRAEDAAKFRRMEELIAYAWYAAGREDEAKAIAAKVGSEVSREP